MSASALLEELKAAGLTVRTVRGWETRGNRWSRRKPIGVMQHHTTSPVPYPIGGLDGSSDGRIKCNMNTKPDGTLWLIAYDACNYSSGKGSSIVWEETLRAIAPRENANRRGLRDDMYGNRYYWNFENDHAGTGGPLPDAQFRTIIIATQVVNRHFGFKPAQCVSHAEWTARKVDPYWNGNRRAIVDIRSAVAGKTPTPTQPKEATQMLPLEYKDGWSTGPRPHKRADVAMLQAMFGLDYGSQQGFYGPSTAEDIGKALGTGPVNHFGHEEAQLAAAKGIFVGGGGGGSIDTSRFAEAGHGHDATVRLT